MRWLLDPQKIFPWTAPSFYHQLPSECPVSITAFEFLYQQFFRLFQQEVPRPHGPSPTYLPPCVFPCQPPPHIPVRRSCPDPAVPDPQHFFLSSFPQYSLLFKSWEDQVRPQYPSTLALRCSLGLTYCLLQGGERTRLRTQKLLLSETTESPRQ